MKPQASENLLIGDWEFDGSSSRANPTCARIEWLVGEYLIKIAISPQWGDWEVLYADPSDGRYWELTYPKGELHGGGPPQLMVLSPEAAKQKYRLAD